MKKLLISTFMYLFSSGAIGAGSDGTFTFLAYGTHSCGKYIEAVNKGNNDRNWIDWNEYQAFVYGYFTGVNRYMPDTVNIKGNTDMEGVMAYIEKYCRENPLKDFFDGINAVQLELYLDREK